MSLRLRLVLIILLPLLFIAGLIGTWAVYDAQLRASERFDRSLLSAVLAVSRDVAVSGGDALSPETSALLQDTSGGRVFYHVYAPDGVFVTGYATPPVPRSENLEQEKGQVYFDSIYQGANVRVLRFSDTMQIDGLSGAFNFTVWQNTVLRAAIVRDLSWRTFQIMAALVVAVGFVVWFGVRTGLRPLLDLEKAIEQRSPGELTPIKRKVPVEARGIVHQLNQLLEQVSSTLEAKDVFLSNAAHQLRNPIAGVVAMSDAMQSAKSFEDMQERSVELAKASRRAGDLANKLLALERASAGVPSNSFGPVNLCRLIQKLENSFLPNCQSQNVSFSVELPQATIVVSGDATMITEATTNLIENALIHGGQGLTKISIELRTEDNFVTIEVQDDGCGIAPKNISKARERFGQIHPSQGSGLGISIAEAVAKHHDGRLSISSPEQGLRVTLELKSTTGKPIFKSYQANENKHRIAGIA